MNTHDFLGKQILRNLQQKAGNKKETQKKFCSHQCELVSRKKLLMPLKKVVIENCHRFTDSFEFTFETTLKSNLLKMIENWSGVLD